MCTIISTYFNKTDKQAGDILENYIAGQSRTNKDGFAMVYTTPTGLKTERGLEYNALKVKKAIKSANKPSGYIHFHLRQATTGAVNADNAHFWQAKDWLFAHNGVVSNMEYKTGTKETKTDSEQFFDKLLTTKLLKPTGKIAIEKIQKFTNEENLRGRYVLIHIPTGKNYFVGDYTAYCMPSATAMFVSSKSISISEKVRFNGFDFDIPYNQRTEIDLLDENIDGVLAVDTAKNRIHYHKAISTYTGYNTTGYNNGVKITSAKEPAKEPETTPALKEPISPISQELKDSNDLIIEEYEKQVMASPLYTEREKQDIISSLWDMN